MKIRSVLLIAGAALMGASCASAPEADEAVEAASEGAAPLIGDSASTMDVHLATIIPGSNALFAAESEPPMTDAQWAAVKAGAQQVIEGANLLMVGSRPPGSSDWMMHAGTVISATEITATALAAGNADELVFTNGDMMTGCTACHQQFRNPQQ